MNSSDEYWEFAGVSLHQYGWSVQTLTGRYGVPPLRGDNQRAAGVHGELWLPKIPDATTITLPMFVIGVDPGTGDAVDDPRARWNDNLAYLRQVFWNPDAESTLTRRWSRLDPVTGQPVIAQADALAQLAPGETLQPQMTTRTRCTITVNLRLAHPYFYGPQQSTTLTPGVQATIVNGGDYLAWPKNLYIDLVGPLTAPKLANSSTGPAVVGLSGNVAAGETVTLDVRQFLALSSRSGSTTQTNRTGEIYNSGTKPWMVLQRGTNHITLTAGGSGHAVLRFRPPYL